MIEPSEFTDEDIFDPDVLERAEKEAKVSVELTDEKVQEVLRRRVQAYRAVFSEGHTSREDVEYVLNDMARFCRATQSTYSLLDGERATELMHIKEGRREVYLRILDFAKVSFNNLYVKYTETNNQ